MMRNKYMKMYYEDFTNDSNANEVNFTEAFKFFGLDINPIVKVPTKKFGPDKLKDRVKNYNKLHEYFEKNAPEYLKYVEEQKMAMISLDEFCDIADSLAEVQPMPDDIFKKLVDVSKNFSWITTPKRKPSKMQ